VAVIELDRAVLPASASIRFFGPDHLQRSLEELEVGTALQIVAFLWVLRHAPPSARRETGGDRLIVRRTFPGEGCFLTDARMHRGMSGAPVVLRTAGRDALPWKLLGVHSSRMDMISRDRQLDDALGLNVAWYADILMVLTSLPSSH